jgi:hypothetical protein
MDVWLQPLSPGTAPFDLSLGTLLLSLLLAFVLGQAIAWTYLWSHSGLSYSRSFTQSLLLLTLLVTLVMMVIGNSIVTAFGLLGALALIRFRNVLKDTRDTVFVFMALVIGMAVGTQRYLLAIVGALAAIGIVLYVNYTSFGSHVRYDGYLTVRLEGGGGSEEGASRLLTRFCKEMRRISTRRTGAEAEAELIYHVGLRDRSRGDELVEELRKLPEVTHASLLLRDEMSEV